MPVIRVPVKIKWNGAGTPGVNVWHIRTVSELNELGAQLWQVDGALTAIKKFYDDHAGLRPASVVHTIGEDVVDVETDEIVPGVSVNTSVGSMGEAYAPMAAMMVVGWRTTLSARRGRGRTFCGPLHAGVIDADGTPTQVALTTLRNAAQNLVNSSSAANGWAVGVWGQEAQFAPEPKVLRDVVSMQVRDTFAVLRSRRD